MDINKNIFKEYDIRGVYLNEIDEEAVSKISSAFCLYLKEKELVDNKKGDTLQRKIVIGRDVRLSSPEFYKIFKGRCLARGWDIIDIGVVTTPMLYFAVNLFKAVGGAMIIASHSPSQYNGIKLVREEAEPVAPKEILDFIEDLPEDENIDESQRGSLEKMDVQSAFIDFLSSYFTRDVGNITIVADASNGAAGDILKNLLDKIKISYWPLFFNPDGRFPNHSPNPLDKDAQQKAKEIIIHKKADFGFVVDADGDRIVFIDEKGNVVRGELITSLFVDHLTEQGDSVIVDMVTSKSVFDIGKEKGVEVERVRTGHFNIKKAMKEKEAVFAGEMSGHYYFKDFSYADSALLAFVRVLDIYISSRKIFSALVSQYDNYFHSREYNFKVSDQSKIKEVFEILKERYKDGEQVFVDGLTIEYKDWWFNLRESHTEPLVRFNVEANTKELLSEKIQELTSIINGHFNGKNSS